jgi:hypothetical protein
MGAAAKHGGLPLISALMRWTAADQFGDPVEGPPFCNDRSSPDRVGPSE